MASTVDDLVSMLLLLLLLLLVVLLLLPMVESMILKGGLRRRREDVVLVQSEVMILRDINAVVMISICVFFEMTSLSDGVKLTW